MKKVMVMMLVGSVFCFGSARADEIGDVELVTNTLEYQPMIRLGGEIPLAADTLRIESVTCSTGGVWTVTSNLSLMRETLTINGSSMEVRVMRAAITTELDAETMQAALGEDYTWAQSAAQAGSFNPSSELKAAILATVGAKLVGAE